MIESFLKYLTYEKRYSRHTITSYQSDLIQFQLFLKENFNGLEISEAKHQNVRAWIVSLMESKIKPKSINRKIVTLRSFFKFLIKNNYLEQDPTTRVSVLKSNRDLPDFIHEEEMNRLLDHYPFELSFQGMRDRVILELFYCTGIRLAELLNIKSTDIDFDKCQLKVLGKRNKERIIPYPKSLNLLLEKYLAVKMQTFNESFSGYLLVTDKNKPCYPMMIYRVVSKYLSIFTTIDKRSPHVLRHSFATHLLNKGADLNAVKDLLGHASLTSTQIYTHNSLEKIKKVFNKAHPKA